MNAPTIDRHPDPTELDRFLQAAGRPPFTAWQRDAVTAAISGRRVAMFMPRRQGRTAAAEFAAQFAGAIITGGIAILPNHTSKGTPS